MRKIDVLFLLLFIACVSMIPRSQQVLDSTNRPPSSPESAHEVKVNQVVRNPSHRNKFRLAELKLGMSRDEAEKLKGRPQNIDSPNGRETWHWSDLKQENYLQANFGMGVLNSIQSNRADPFYKAAQQLPGNGSSKSDVLKALGPPDRESPRHLTYENLPETLIFMLQDDTVHSITLEFTKSKLPK